MSDIKINKWIFGLLFIVLASCEYDNYEQPEAMFQGRVVYQGEPLSLTNTYFQLWEPGWQTRTSIGVGVQQDGSFSAKIFNATYQLVFPPEEGPFMVPTNEVTGNDTIMVDVSGNTTLDIEVTPYYMVREPAFSMSGNSVAGTCRLEQIITGDDARNIERVVLYLSKTQFVDQRTAISSTEMARGDIADLNRISLAAEIPEMIPTQSFVYARLAVKLEGREDMIYSQVQKIDI